jgi:hypothetical protein
MGSDRRFRAGSRRRTMRASHAAFRRHLGNVARDLAALDTMTVGELVAKYRELYGEPTRSRNKIYLQKRLAWRIQELAEGGLSKSAVELIAKLGDAMPESWRIRLRAPEATSPVDTTRDGRLPPPGSVLTRTYQGATHEVRVLSDGFEYRGTHYSSLSKIAKHITGTPWNGLVFFGVSKRRRTPENQTKGERHHDAISSRIARQAAPR